MAYTKNIRVRAAGVLVKDNGILLIKHKKNDQEYWLLPGGGVDYGETFQEAVVREFKEETNLDVRVKDMLFIMESIDPNGSRHIVNVTFEVEYLSGEMTLGDDTILGELKYIDVGEFSNITLYPNIKKELIDFILGKNQGIKYIDNRWD